MHNPSAVVLAGDIGGTNARFVVFVNGEYQAGTFRAIPVANFNDLADVIEVYLQDIGRQTLDQASFSVASTAEYGDEINLTNADLRFSIADLRQRFSLHRVKVVNDFTAAALGVVCIADDSLYQLHKGSVEPLGPLSLIHI